MKKMFGLVIVILLAGISFAQKVATSGDIYLGLRKLNVLGSVLYIAAHPDDENTRLLTFLANDRLYRTGYLSLTRGDGGQNLIGDDQGIDLGLIRTQELLSARRIDGAEQYFTRAFDFGFSKTPEETFTKWDREKVLADVVWVIRKFQPDVIITRFPTTGEGGHGHHTASAILANEAFTAAADPKQFPEQLKYVQPWQARRILWNTFNFGSTNTTSNNQFHFDVGGYNAVLGKSYGEIAAESRSQHKSQGFGVARTRGEALEYFKTTGGAAPATDLFEDITTGWQRVNGSSQIVQQINSAIASFDFMQPQKTVPQLVQIYKAIKDLPAGYWKEQKLKETQQLIEAASGLWMEAYTSEPYVAQGDLARINISVNNRLGAGVKWTGLALAGGDSLFNTTLSRNRNINFVKSFSISPTRNITQPYWLQKPMQEGYYNVTDQQLIGQPDIDPAFTATFRMNIEGEDFVFEKPVRYRFTDPVKGELYEPFVVLPKVEVNYVNENNFSFNGKPIETSVHLKANKKDTSLYTLRQLYSKNWTTDRPSFPMTVGGNLENYASSLFTPVQKDANMNETISVRASNASDIPYEHTRKTIRYDHIPWITYFPQAHTHLVVADLKTEGKKIGYIVGAGDKVPEALEQMGYEVTLLTDKELSRNNLQQFDAIISGVRAYNTNEWLNKYYEKLMNYVSNGGNLIVQYNTSNQIGPVRARIGPYNFDITRTRITDENAAVTFLQPDHPVLNFPNKITGEDFKGWIQERSIYHAASLDPAFQSILRMNDPGEAPDDGSLVIAKYGKGFFTYTGLVFFRELPAGVPGAYRLFANLVALNHKKVF